MPRTSRFFKFKLHAPKIKFRKNNESKDDIRDEIDKDQDEIISPNKINNAQHDFDEEDPEIAKLLLEANEAILRKDLRDAEDKAAEIVTKNKKCAQAYVIFGNVAFLRGMFDDAKEAYKTAVKCNPTFDEAYFGLGKIELKKENLTEAIKYLQRAVTLNRNVAEWYAELGRAYMEVRQFAKAAKALKRASNLDFENEEYKKLAKEAEEKQRSHLTALGLN